MAIFDCVGLVSHNCVNIYFILDGTVLCPLFKSVNYLLFDYIVLSSDFFQIYPTRLHLFVYLYISVFLKQPLV